MPGRRWSTSQRRSAVAWAEGAHRAHGITKVMGMQAQIAAVPRAALAAGTAQGEAQTMVGVSRPDQSSKGAISKREAWNSWPGRAWGAICILAGHL